MKLSVATQNLACQRPAEAVSIMCYGLHLRLLNVFQLPILVRELHCASRMALQKEGQIL